MAKENNKTKDEYRENNWIEEYSEDEVPSGNARGKWDNSVLDEIVERVKSMPSTKVLGISITALYKRARNEDIDLNKMSRSKRANVVYQTKEKVRAHLESNGISVEVWTRSIDKDVKVFVKKTE